MVPCAGYWWFCKEFKHGLIINAVLIHVMCFRRLSMTAKIHIGSCIWKLYRMLANSAHSQLWSFVNTWGLSLPPSWDCIRLATCDFCKWIRSNVSILTASHFHTAIQQLVISANELDQMFQFYLHQACLNSFCTWVSDLAKNWSNSDCFLHSSLWSLDFVVLFGRKMGKSVVGRKDELITEIRSWLSASEFLL